MRSRTSRERRTVLAPVLVVLLLVGGVAGGLWWWRAQGSENARAASAYAVPAASRRSARFNGVKLGISTVTV